MVQLIENMDEHSRDIKVNGVFIGFYQWHSGQPRLELHSASAKSGGYLPIMDISISDMEEILRLGELARAKQKT